jgi:hypothetical protein
MVSLDPEFAMFPGKAAEGSVLDVQRRRYRTLHRGTPELLLVGLEGSKQLALS